MFKLEALKARHGDCLLLHWGDKDSPHLAVIDGGPATVYREYLRPRLKQLAKARGGNLVVELLMVSHIDDDHINGVLAFAKELDNNRAGEVEEDGALPVKVRRLWHNSLEGLLKDSLSAGETASVTASATQGLALLPVDGEGQDAPALYYNKVLASVPQGQELHGYAQRMAWRMNPPFEDPPLVTQRTPAKTTSIGGLELTVLAPSMESVEALRKVWKEKRKDGVLAAYSDRSPYNLSSIVALAKFGDGCMLLTGDARGDHILAGLEAAGLLDEDGRIHVDVLKLAHHGSKNNVKQDFFERVTADHYVVSGDRDKFPNPSVEAMQWLHAARGDAPYRIYCTYEIKDMRKLFGDRLVTPQDDAVVVSI